MSDLKITYDPVAEDFLVEPTIALDIGCYVSMFVKTPEKLMFSKMRVGIEFSGLAIPENVAWPQKDQVILSVDESMMYSAMIQWNLGTEVSMRMWLEIDGVVKDMTYKFTTLRPPKPFPSWTWENHIWTPPKPYPNISENQQFSWDEATLDWLIS